MRTGVTVFHPPTPDDDLSWQDNANCKGADQDLFFPEKGKGRSSSTREARVICAGCAVRDPCLDFAVEHGEKFGIWGGLSERERRRVRRERLLEDTT